MQCGCLFFFSLTLFVGLSYAQNTPQTLELSANIVTAGDQLNASCTATTSTVARSLLIDGQPIDERINNTSRLNTSQEANSLKTTWTIDPVQPGDGGEYICFVSEQITSESSSPPQTVTVHFSPVLTIPVPPDSVLLGQSVAVNIFVSAVPEITDFEVSLPSESAIQPSHSAAGVTSTFEFSSVNRYNNGAYTVNFTNAVGSSTVDFQLTVYFGPFFSYGEKEQMDGASISKPFSEGQNITLLCDVTASNPVVFTLLLSMSPGANNEKFDMGTGTITITRATAANAGIYTCIANNGKTTPTTISFVLTMDMPRTTEPTTRPTPTTDSAGSLLATVSVAVVMLLAAILLS